MSTVRLSIVGMVSRVLLIFMNMASLILLARYLEPKGRGEYFLFQTFVSVLCVLGDLGLSQSANVFMGRNAEHKALIHAVVAKATFLLWLGMTLIAGAVLWCAGDKLLPGFPVQWQWAAFALLPFTLYAGFWNGMMVGLGEIWWLNGVQVLLGPLQLVLVLVFIVARSGGVGTAIAIYFLVMLAQFGMMMTGSIRLGMFKSLQRDAKGLSRDVVRFGVRGYPNAVATMLWMRVPVFLLNASHGAVAVGIFSVAQQLAEKALLPAQAMQDAIYRKMATLSAAASVQTMNRYLRIVFAAVGIATIGGAFLAPSVVWVLFGDDYEPAVPVFRVLLAGIAFVSVAMIVSTYLLSQRERPGLLSILAGANAVACVLFSVWLVPRWSAIGAASALAMTQLVGAVVVVSIYLSLAAAPFKEVFLPNRRDVAVLVEQLSALVCRKRT